MYEYIFVFAVTVTLSDPLIIIELLKEMPDVTFRFESPILKYKAIKTMRAGNVDRFIVLPIIHNRKENIEEIVKDVKDYVMDKKNYICLPKDCKYYEMVYCFAIAPKYDRWDIIKLKSMSQGQSQEMIPNIEIVDNFNRCESNVFVPIKRICKKRECLEEMKQEIFQYINDQSKKVKAFD